MTLKNRNCIVAGVFGIAILAFRAFEAHAAPPVPSAPEMLESTIRPFFQQHCIKCHGPEKHKGDLVLHTLGIPAAGKESDTWKKVAEMIATGEMPPAGQARPSPHIAGKVLVWAKGELSKIGVDVSEIGQKLNRPQHGNRIDHDALFDAGSKALAASPARVWRASPQMYTAFGKRIFDKKGALAQPFSSSSAEGFKDYSDLFIIDEPTINQLMRNADAIVAVQTAPRGGQRQLMAITQGTPSAAEVTAAIQQEFQLVLLRSATAEELKRFSALYEKNVRDAGQEIGARATLATVFLLPEALYRLELGAGPADASGRRMLAPRELANAIAAALGDDGPDSAILKAAETGALRSAADVRIQFERLLADPRFAKPKIMRFFDEYFEFPAAADVFKDFKRGQWRPEILIGDTRRLIQWVLDQDKDVLRTLLTTNKSFVNYKVDAKAPGGAAPAHITNKREDKAPDPKKLPKKRGMEYSDLYNLPENWAWTAEQPIELPREQRAGVLTQPSWLAAYATNDQTHAIRRGKWVRERLLGGAVPDLPITVDAMLPNRPDQTLRERMKVTSQEYCWNCHRQMNPLGLTFESFDFIGRYRTTETVVDAPATAEKEAAAQAAHAQKKGKKADVAPPPVPPVMKEVHADTTGLVEFSGDPKIDGPVSDAVAMLHELADSPRVRQVFVRHSFRFWMGRNETLDDAPTLVAADQAYLKSGGSMKALILALVTSDSFLYRQQPASDN